MKMTAIVLAGSRPGRDPLAAEFGTDLKALIPILGEEMVRRPVRALLGSESVSRVIVVSQDPDRIAAALDEDARVEFRTSRGTIAETMLELCTDDAVEWPLLVTTADHALLQSAMIDDFSSGAGGSDVAVGVVERSDLLKRFPDAKRTWIKFRGGAFTGANLFALNSPRAADAIQLWSSVEQSRKKGWRLLSLLGPLVVAGAALRLLSIDDVLARVGRKLGLRIRAVRMTDPIAGIDVDKLSDHGLAEAILEGRA
jgi:GTP:adenosylcobinamide-phosphate guanylyltransferase